MATLASTDDLARTLLQTTAVAFAVSEVSIRFRSARQSDASRADRGSIVAVVLGITIGALVAVWCAVNLPGTRIPGGWVPFGLGLALIWLGIALRQWAVLTLGRFFTVAVRVADDQVVVDRGPYHWVRHPSYTGLLLTLVGLGVALGSWLSVLALALFPTVGLVVRMRVEEEALLSTLGEPYRAYAEHRARLVPGLW
jgi:protein-S-isoprenylcysteine O-methyltransferase Ste14